MKKFISFALVLTLLFSCGVSQILAVEVSGEDSFMEQISNQSADELFQRRAELLFDPNATQEDFDNIDAQLRAIGVEELSPAEIAQINGDEVQPLYNVDSTTDTKWYSQRKIAVARGVQYEAQIITGQPNNTNSDLFNAKVVVKNKASSKKLGAINALQVLVTDVATNAVSTFSPVVGTAYAVSTTLYNMIKGYYEGVTSSTVLSNVKYSFTVATAITVRFAYVKYAGAADDGNQVQCYKGNSVSYTISATIPTLKTTNGTAVADTTTLKFSDTATSYGFDVDTCANIAAENYRLYKAGQTMSDVYYDIVAIPMIVFDTKYTASTRTNGAPIY